MVSQWLAGELPVGPLDLYYEGSPFDRLFLSALIVSAVAVLMTRARQCGPLLRDNGPLVVFFLYCLLSVLWSEAATVWLQGRYKRRERRRNRQSQITSCHPARTRYHQRAVTCARRFRATSALAGPGL